MLSFQRKPVVSSHSMLGREYFHSAWVTNDLDKAVAIFADRYGVSEFSYLEGPMPTGGDIRVALAWAGGQILEIIQASGPATEFYNQQLPSEGFAIRFHHLGFNIPDEAAWRQLEDDIRDGGWKVAYKTVSGDFIDAYYVEAPELGHYLEYVRPHSAGAAFYAAVPAN